MSSNRIQDGSRKTVPDHFFTVICSFQSLIRVPYFSPVLILLWMILFVFYMASILSDLKRYFIDSARPPSLVKIVFLLGDVIDISASSQIVVGFVRKQGEIQALLRRSGRKFSDVFVPCLYEIPVICLHAYYAIMREGSLMVVSNYTSSIFIETFVGAFLVVYADLLKALIESSTELCRLSNDPRKSLDELIASKWELRDKIAAVNNFSRLPLLIHYVRMILTALYVFIIKLNPSPGRRIKTFAFCAHSAAYFMTMYYLARRASTLDLHHNAMAQHIMMRPPIQSVDAVVVRRVFAFQDSLDAVRLGCSTHGPKVFFKAVLLLLTTAVPLLCQFDHKIIRRITNLTNEAIPGRQQDLCRIGAGSE